MAAIKDTLTPDGLPTLAAAAAAENKRRRTDDRTFQRVWTEDDEITVLRGFLAFTAARRGGPVHDSGGLFYDQIRPGLRLDVNRSQLSEKLRRLKKKHRIASARLAAGHDNPFKTPHDHTLFVLSSKIWSSGGHIDDDDDNENVTPLKLPASAPANYYSPTPIASRGPSSDDNCDAANIKWRRQEILELEALSRRCELVREQIKLQLAELRSRGQN